MVRIDILSNTRCIVRKADDATRTLLDDALAMEVPGARFDPRVRRGLWDGRRHLFSVERGTFPRGLLKRVKALLDEAGTPYKVKDKRTKKPAAPDLDRLTPTILKGVELRDYQMTAARKALKRKSGILWIATNGGKTEIACAIMRVMKERRALFLTHKKVLLTQTRERIAKRFGTIEQHIGIIGDGRFDPKHITVATIQSLTRKMPPAKRRIINQYLKTIEQLHVDEGHHTKATTWYRLIQKMDAPFRYIYSGTPFGGGNGLMVEAAVGPVVARVSNQTLIDKGVSAQPTIEMVECAEPELPEGLQWDEVYKLGIVNNAKRNGLIAGKAKAFAKAKKPTLILVKELWHGDNISRELSALDIKHYWVHGQMPVSEVDRLKARFAAGRVPVLIASTIFDEGVDVPAIRALIVADGGQSVRAVLQKIGRGLRKKEGGDNTLSVVDFADMTHRYLTKHSQERLVIYEGEGFKVVTK